MLLPCKTIKANEIDTYVNEVLQEKGFTPSALCSDESFIRRTYLVTTGKLPSIQVVISFLKDIDSNKRSKLINKLLSANEYVDFQALKWGDLLRIKSEFPSNLWPNAVQAYNRWVRVSIRDNKPYNQFVKELLLSSGSNFRSPEVNFYRAFQSKSAKNIAANVSLLFLGTRDSDSALSVFFSQIKYKATEEWKEEIVYNENDISSPIHEVLMSDGTTIELPTNNDFRVSFVNWLTSPSNTQFAEVIVNRIWYWLMGTGIVHQPDDFNASNPPSNPKLLKYLANELMTHHYDLQYIFRLILNSNTYQRSSETNASNMGDNKYFSHYQLRRLTAEEFVDAIGTITGINDTYMSRVPEPFTFLPTESGAINIGDGSITSTSLEMYGRASRDVSYESDRNNNPSTKQVLFLLNSPQINDKIKNSKTLKGITDNATDVNNLIDNMYLLILSRYPTKNESQILNEYATNNKLNKNQLSNDLVWSLLNTREFILNH